MIQPATLISIPRISPRRQTPIPPYMAAIPTAPITAPVISFVDSENRSMIKRSKGKKRRVGRLTRSLPDNSANRPTLRDGRWIVTGADPRRASRKRARRVRRWRRSVGGSAGLSRRVCLASLRDQTGDGQRLNSRASSKCNARMCA